MVNKILFYVCVGCSVFGAVTSFIFALAGFWIEAISSTTTTVCLWFIYLLIGKISDSEEKYRNIIELAEKYLVENGKMAHRIKVLESIIKVYGGIVPEE